ncbi:invasion associated locus B family protein [Amorphus orientalis]|uniref:Invasion protein IalB n=1 Tax=Amorphus orientalis TaxID=649198 RepID=A0AAE3VQ02_9HYPH|nr:invasion associated locus B family protein [Amorphus orientalis]MDQ0315670.1 invasion protein IalB [Amorphus orientalis]
MAERKLSTKAAALTTSIAVAGAIALAAMSPVSAQEAAEQDQNPWVKVCNTDPNTQKEVCLVTQELRTDRGQFMASVAIREISGEDRRVLLSAVPVGMLIQPGLRVQIDGGEQQQARYSICFPNACYAEMVVESAFVNKLKAGGNLKLTTLNQQGKPVNFDVTLSGFTAAYDGEALEPQALQQQQEQLQEELNRKAQAARQRLIEEQRKASEAAQGN